MTKSDLIEVLAAKPDHQLQYKDVELAVRHIVERMSNALASGERIEVRGFGSFSVTHRPPRLGRNPRSGAAVHIPPKRVPHFKPGKALREAVAQLPPETGA